MRESQSYLSVRVCSVSLLMLGMLLSINQSKTKIFHCPETNTTFSAYNYNVYSYLVITTLALLHRSWAVQQNVQMRKLVSHIT